jgi:disulfide bond formation protein DsbB
MSHHNPPDELPVTSEGFEPGYARLRQLSNQPHQDQLIPAPVLVNQTKPMSFKSRLGLIIALLIGPVLVIIGLVIIFISFQTDAQHQGYLSTVQTANATVSDCSPYYNVNAKGVRIGMSSTFVWMSYSFNYNDRTYANTITTMISQCSVGTNLPIQFVPADPTLSGKIASDFLAPHGIPPLGLGAVGTGIVFILWNFMIWRFVVSNRRK